MEYNQGVKTTRQRLLEQLEAWELVSAGDLSRALKITAADVRHHLTGLVAEGVVEMVSQRRTAGRGRPPRLYTLVRRAQRHNLDGLASALLQEFLDSLDAPSRQQALQRLAARLLEYPPEVPRSLAGRLYQATRRLNELGYHSRWEARAQAPQLILGHCPYLAILPRHPELCQMDAFLLGCLLQTPVAQTAKLESNSRGSTCCRFLVKKP